MSKLGIVRDEYGITGKDKFLTFGDNIFVFYLPIIIIVLNIISILLKNVTKQIIYIELLLSVCAIVVSAIVIVKINNNVNNYHPAKVEFEELSLNTLAVFIEEKKSGIIYIKRDDCVQCDDMDKFLNNMISTQSSKIYFYSTTRDRDTNAEEMYKVLDSIEVSYVPMLLVCDDGIIKNFFTMDNKEELAKIL